MKEIKAYVRRDEVNALVEELQGAGAPGVSVIEIHPVGYGYEPSCFEPHVAGLVQRHRYLAVVKLEIICADHQLDRLVRVIHAHCHTGARGDGMIFVSEIVDVVRIRDGERGEEALRRSSRERREVPHQAAVAGNPRPALSRPAWLRSWGRR